MGHRLLIVGYKTLNL